MSRCTIAGALVAGLLAGCAATPERSASTSLSTRAGAIDSAGLDADASRAARWAGIDDTVWPSPVSEPMVVATARAPVHTLPTTSSRLLGTLKQSGEIVVEEKLLWARATPQMDSPNAGDDRSWTPTWAKFRVGDVVGYVPWSCLVTPSRYEARPPADVMLGAESDLQDIAFGTFGSPSSVGGGGLPWMQVFATRPDRDAVDGFILAAEPRAFPTLEAASALETSFDDPSPADRFFLGRELAGRILAVVPAADSAGDMAVRVATIGAAVARESRLPRPYADWIWIVLEAPDVVDAFALPGGFVFVTSGLVEAVSDAELSALLGREVARVERSASMRAMGEGLQRRADRLRRFALDGGDARGDADRWSDAEQAIALAAESQTPLAWFADEIDDDPVAIDLRGVALSAAAGFDPWALTDFTVRMINEGRRVPGMRISPAAALELAGGTEALMASRDTVAGASPESSVEE